MEIVWGNSNWLDLVRELKVGFVCGRDHGRNWRCFLVLINVIEHVIFGLFVDSYCLANARFWATVN